MNLERYQENMEGSWGVGGGSWGARRQEPERRRPRVWTAETAGRRLVLVEEARVRDLFEGGGDRVEAMVNVNVCKNKNKTISARVFQLDALCHHNLVISNLTNQY